MRSPSRQTSALPLPCRRTSMDSARSVTVCAIYHKSRVPATHIRLPQPFGLDSTLVED